MLLPMRFLSLLNGCLRQHLAAKICDCCSQPLHSTFVVLFEAILQRGTVTSISSKIQECKNTYSKRNLPIGHFRVAFYLCFKMSLGAQPFIWKCIFSFTFIVLEINLISIWKVVHQDSFWNRGRRQLGNGLLWYRFGKKLQCQCNGAEKEGIGGFILA